MAEKPNPLIIRAKERFLSVKEFVMMKKNISWFFDSRMALLTIYGLGIVINKIKIIIYASQYPRIY